MPHRALRLLTASAVGLLLSLAVFVAPTADAGDAALPPALPPLPNPLAMGDPEFATAAPTAVTLAPRAAPDAYPSPGNVAPPPAPRYPSHEGFARADDAVPADSPAPTSAPVDPVPVDPVPQPVEIVFEDAVVADAPTTAPVLRRRRSRWSVNVEVGAGLYDDPEGIMGLAPSRGRPAFDWGENNFDAGFGARLTVTKALRGCDRLEFRGSYQGWSEDGAQTAQFGFTPTPGGAVTLSPVATATLENEVDLWSLEFNWWKALRGTRASRLEWGLGARVIRLTDTAIARDWVGLAGAAAYLEGEAQNTLWAGQAMGAWRLQPSRRFEFAIIGKVLAGALNRDLTEKDNSIVTGGATSDANTERTDFGWGLEGELRATWRPWARVGFTASYTVLFLDDVSRGHEILDFTQAATGSIQIFDTTDSIVVHTLFLGVHFDL